MVSVLTWTPAGARVATKRFYLGDSFTTVKHGEISRGLLAEMLKQLGIDRREF